MGLFSRKKIEKMASVSMEAEKPSFSSRGQHPSFDDITVGDMSSGVPRIRVGQMFGSFKRQLKWFIPLLIIGTLAAWYYTKDFKRVYHADGSILVQLGSEYVYDPVGAEQSNGAGLTLTPDHITQNEIALMKNSSAISTVTGLMEERFGARFAEDNYNERQKYPTNSREYQDAVVALQTIVGNNFGVAAKPKSSILVVSYKHEDPEIAKATLKAFIDTYQSFRRTLFVEGTSEVITEGRVATEGQVKENEQAIARFLSRNAVSDFDSEREGVTERTEELRETLNTLRADLAENERALATVENQLRSTPEQIDLQIDDRPSQRLAQAELELSQLLAKYLPTSEPVRRKQAEVDQIKNLQSSYGNTIRGGRRVGPNTVYQELETRRNTLQSTADALREKEITVQRQLNSADDKVRKLQSLSPKYANLLRERETLDERLKDYIAKEQEALINQQQAQANSENVIVIDNAIHARKGRNMRALMFVLATVGWGLTLGLIALMRVFLDPALYVGQQVRGRRSVDRSAAAGMGGATSVPNYHDPVVHEPAAASMPQTQIPTPVEAPIVQSNVPDVWQAVPSHAAQSHAAPSHAAPSHVAPGYVAPSHVVPGYEQNQYAAPQYNPAYTGNTALDFYANPYVNAADAPYEQAALPPQTYIGTVPQSPEG